MPTARLMPISVFRSAASITKIIIVSRMPAPMENSPSTMKKVISTLPASSAVLTPFALRGSTLYCVPFSCALELRRHAVGVLGCAAHAAVVG